MKRLLLGSLLSCMLIGQVSCKEDQIVSQTGIVADMAAAAGIVVGLLAPPLVVHYTNAADWIKKYTEKYKIAEKIGIKRYADAAIAAWWWSAASIIAGSTVIANITDNATIGIVAAASGLGACISIGCSCAV